MLTMSLPPKLINTDQESDFLMNTDKTIETPQSPRISVAPMMDWTHQQILPFNNNHL